MSYYHRAVRASMAASLGRDSTRNASNPARSIKGPDTHGRRLPSLYGLCNLPLAARYPTGTVPKLRLTIESFSGRLLPCPMTCAILLASQIIPTASARPPSHVTWRLDPDTSLPETSSWLIEIIATVLVVALFLCLAHLLSRKYGVLAVYRPVAAAMALAWWIVRAKSADDVVLSCA